MKILAIIFAILAVLGWWMALARWTDTEQLVAELRSDVAQLQRLALEPRVRYVRRLELENDTLIVQLKYAMHNPPKLKKQLTKKAKR